MHTPLTTLVTSIPAPPVRNLEVGPLQLHMYGLLIGIGVVLAISLVERLFRRQGLDETQLIGVLVPAVLAGFVGARLYHVASEPIRYARAPLDIVKIWEGGLGIYGGVLLGSVTAVVMARRRGMPLGPLLDAGAVGLPLAQAIGRWGNYFNQELFGGPSTLPWALEVDPAYRPAELAMHQTFHPTFLYESLGNLVVFAIMLALVVRWRSRPPGIVFPVYVAAYSLLRFGVEGMRVDDAHTMLGLRQNEWVAGTLFVVATLVALRTYRRAARASAGADAA